MIGFGLVGRGALLSTLSLTLACMHVRIINNKDGDKEGGTVGWNLGPLPAAAVAQPEAPAGAAAGVSMPGKHGSKEEEEHECM